MEEIKTNLEDLEVKIEKYPSACSPRLLEEFLIIGYEDALIESKLLNSIKRNKAISSRKSNVSEDDNSYLIKVENFNMYPSVLSVISSLFEGNEKNNLGFILSSENLISFLFAKPIPVYFKIMSNNENEKDIQVNKYQELKIKRIIFNNSQNYTINIGYAYNFYETRFENINNTKIVIFIPKSFVIISQYQLFYFFDKLCKEIRTLYSNVVEIPIEIIIYNIINFVPAPVKNKLELDFFPKISLEKIAKYNSVNEYKNTDKFNLKQLIGYRYSEIYFGNIFNLLPVKVIIQTFLHLFHGAKVAFFSENQENLHLIIFFFNQFIYPLLDKENIWGLSPTKYFTEVLADNSRIGFLCNYDDIQNYDPFSPKEQFKNLVNEEDCFDFKRGVDDKVDKGQFDFILDLKNKKLILNKGINNNTEENNNNNGEDVNRNDEENYEQKGCSSDISKSGKDLTFLYNKIKEFLDNPSEVEGFLFEKILVLLTKLESYSKIHENCNNILSIFNENEERKNLSKNIIETFLQFNLISCYHFLKNYSAYKGDIEKYSIKAGILDINELGAKFTQQDNIFFIKFSQTPYNDILMNFIGGYLEEEPVIQKTVRRIFEYLISLISTSETNHKLFDTHYFEIFNSIYLKDNNEQKSLSFFEFFKYYNNNMKDFIFQNIDHDKMECKIVKNNDKPSYFYKYKKIEFDQNILLSYMYFLENIPLNTKNLIFPVADNEISILEIIKNKDLTEELQKLFINNKIINFIDIIYSCILDLVVLSILGYKLIHFTEPVIAIFNKYNFFVRYYVELILSISFRYFNKEKQKNLFIMKKYFDIYEKAVKERKILPNDEIILLVLNRDTFVEAIEEESLENEPNEKFNKEIKQENYEKIESIDENDLFVINCDINKKEEFEDLKKEGKFNCNISFKTEYWINSEKNYDYVYYPMTIHNNLKKLIDELYLNLEIKNFNKEQYNKLVIDIIYYSKLVEGDMPAGIFKFLFYCLNNDK